MSEDLPRVLAEEFVRLHNEASPIFQAAFVSIGARMWRMDDAHPLKEKNTAFIANVIRGYLERGHPEYIREVYGQALTHPLTVMDSYPQCRERRRELERKLTKIYEAGNKKWSDFLTEKGIK